MSRRGVIATVLACLAPAPALTGCGLGAGPAPHGVRLLVSREFGRRTLYSSAAPAVSGQETVMSLLMRNQPVATRYSGGFVQSIGSLAGGQRGGRPVDWFFYVNGVIGERGAAATVLHPGDSVWWDWHDWSQTDGVPAVVGSFPQPFLNGLAGKRLPIRVECETAAATSCSTVAERLRAVGAVAALAAPGSSSSTGVLRVLVGTWSRVRGDPAAQPLQNGPRASGVYGRFSADGRTFTALDQDGRAVRTLAAGTGLIAATRAGEAAPVWVVTGTDRAGVQLAARSFDTATLDDRFAVAVTTTGALALPAG